jgi:hypothetical protein
MRKSVWNEIDFIECLSVIPDVEDDGIASYDGEPVIPMGIRLAVDPDFNIQFF